MAVRGRRVYDDPHPDDSTRVLVDRVWPRGVRKEDLDAEWLRDVAPSPELRRWFGHNPAKFAEFRRRYRAELEAGVARAALEHLCVLGTDALTLLTATRDVEHSHATVLTELLMR